MRLSQGMDSPALTKPKEVGLETCDHPGEQGSSDVSGGEAGGHWRKPSGRGGGPWLAGRPPSRIPEQSSVQDAPPPKLKPYV